MKHHLDRRLYTFSSITSDLFDKQLMVYSRAREERRDIQEEIGTLRRIERWEVCPPDLELERTGLRRGDQPCGKHG